MMGLTNVIVFYLTGLAVSFSQYTSPAFHRTFSSECAESSILTEEDCPLVMGKTPWSRERITAESDTKFMVISESDKDSNKCFSKLSVYTQSCNAIPQCIMTSYKYNLPRPPRGVDPSKCANEYTIEGKCKTNGPGGPNTKAVYNHCFYRGLRPFCGIKFEPCRPERCFKWTKYQRQCYAECNTTSFNGVALQFVRKCKECDGDIVDEELCKGGKEASIQLRRCSPSSRSRRNTPDCVAETTVELATNPTTELTTTPLTSPTTTKGTKKPRRNKKTTTTTITTSTTTTTSATTTSTTESTTILTSTTGTTKMAVTKQRRNKPTQKAEPKVTASATSPSTTEQSATSNAEISRKRRKSTTSGETSTVETNRQTTAETGTTTRNRRRTKPNRQSTTTIADKSTKRQKPTRKPRKTKKPKTTKPQKSKETKVDSRIFAPPVSMTTKASTGNETIGNSPSHDDRQTTNFDLIPLAAGAGAGILVLFVTVLVAVLVIRRRDSKPTPESSFTSSSLKSKATKSAIVDSSSFRIATWITERPSVRRGSSSSFDSAVSDAEYWRVASSDENTAPYSSEKQNQSQSEKVPDVVKALSTNRGKDEHIYDEVEYGDIDDMRTTVPRHASQGGSRQSSTNVYSNIDDEDTAPPQSNESQVYAVVNKDHKRNSKKKSFDAGSSGSRRKELGNSSSVTRLNGRQLKEGVLQIEFDEKEGVRCRLSNSNVYMNLEETEPPTVI